MEWTAAAAIFIGLAGLAGGQTPIWPTQRFQPRTEGSIRISAAVLLEMRICPPGTFEGTLLTDVLSKVAVPIGDGFGGLQASHYVLVEARHGYRAVFASTKKP